MIPQGNSLINSVFHKNRQALAKAEAEEAAREAGAEKKNATVKNVVH